MKTRLHLSVIVIIHQIISYATPIVVELSVNLVPHLLEILGLGAIHLEEDHTR